MSEHDDIYSQDTDVAGKSSGWIQWKNTSVCMDLHCKCGCMSHLDGYFCYHCQCPECGAKYAIGENVLLIPLTPEQIEAIESRSTLPFKIGDLPFKIGDRD